METKQNIKGNNEKRPLISIYRCVVCYFKKMQPINEETVWIICFSQVHAEASKGLNGCIFSNRGLRALWALCQSFHTKPHPKEQSPLHFPSLWTVCVVCSFQCGFMILGDNSITRSLTYIPLLSQPGPLYNKQASWKPILSGNKPNLLISGALPLTMRRKPCKF